MYKSISYFIILIFVFATCSNEKKNDASKTIVTDELTQMNLLIQKDSLNASLYNQRSRIFLGRQQLDKALLDINKALTINTNDAEIFLTLAEIYFVMGKPDNCNASLLKAVDVDPQNPKSFVKLAELNLVLENFNKALAYTDKAFEISSFNPDGYYVRGMVFLAKKDTLSALKNIKLALDQRENFYEALMQLGAIYSTQKHPLAEQYLKRVLVSFPESTQARYELAMYLQDNERVDEAVLHYDTLLQLLPSNKYALYNLGYIELVYQNNFAKAIEYFDEVLAIDPGYLDALYNKGRSLEELGRFVNARDVYDEVLQRKPNYELAVEGLNRLDRRK